MKPVGICLDPIRTLLAEWVVRQGENIDQLRWCPTILKEEICFDRGYFPPDKAVDIVRYIFCSKPPMRMKLAEKTSQLQLQLLGFFLRIMKTSVLMSGPAKLLEALY